MKKINLLLSVLALSAGLTVKAQVGIDTDEPKATLDVTGKPEDIEAVDGIIAPRITGDELKAKDALYAETTSFIQGQTGAIVYVTEAVSGTPVGKTINIITPGYYYYDGNVWQKFLDTDTNTEPTGFERLPNMSAASFYWKLIGAPTINYGTAGKYSLDASWNPEDLDEVIDDGSYTYNAILAISGLSLSDLGAKGINSFTAGTINSASGVFSTAFGAGNEASSIGAFTAGVLNKSTGEYSFTSGISNQATGSSAIALGNTSIASGENSVAIGQANEATAQGAFAVGNTNKATAISAVGIGQANQALGQAAVALGNTNTIYAENALAIGRQNQILGSDGITIGRSLLVTYPDVIAMGRFNTIELNTGRLLVVGKGGISARSDAFTILNNGKVGIDIDNFENTSNSGSDAKLQVNGNIKVAVQSSSSTCDSTNEGSIRYYRTASDTGSFQGCRQASGVFAWVDLH